MRRYLLLTGLALFAGCGDDDDGNPDAGPPDGGSPKPCTTTLSPGSDDQTDVQAALIAADEGDLICFAAGTFTFTDELTLSVAGVTLRGAGRDETIFDFSGSAGGPDGGVGTGGNALRVTAGDFIVEKLTVKDPKGDGIRTEGLPGAMIENVTFRDVRVYWSAADPSGNGAYGVYPVLCRNVLVERVEVSGAADAAIYVGQSENIVVRDSLAHDSVAGIEIENSTDAEVVDNTTHDNTAGILVFNLPDLPTKTGARTKVHGNTIMNNNHENFASAGTVAYVPPGTGILILAADNPEVHENTISGNGSVGILHVTCLALNIASGMNVLNCGDPGYDGISAGAFFHDNTFTNNGTDPQGFFAGLGINPTPTIFYDGLGPTSADDKLCIQEAEGTSFGNFSNESDTISNYDCTHPSLPSIEVTWGTSL